MQHMVVVVGSSGNNELQEVGLGASVLEARSRRWRTRSHGGAGPAPLRKKEAGAGAAWVGEVVAGAPDGAEAERRNDDGFRPDRGGGRRGDRA